MISTGISSACGAEGRAVISVIGRKGKLTDFQAACIRVRAARGEKQAVLALEFGVSEATISQIVTLRSYVPPGIQPLHHA